MLTRVMVSVDTLPNMASKPAGYEAEALLKAPKFSA